jgi:hypothetical protein
MILADTKAIVKSEFNFGEGMDVSLLFGPVT